MKRYFYSLFILLPFFVFSGCKKDEAPTAPQNHLPKIESLTANPTTVLISTETTLTCIAADEDGDNLTITWSSKRGTFSNGVVGVAVKWIAPSTAGRDTITATVNDGKQTIQGKLEIIVGTISASPTLLTPNNNATEVALSPTLTWNASATATSYTLQVSANSSFSSFVYYQSGLTNTSQQISGLNSNATYYWRVNATNSYGTSSWSIPIWSFTTLYICGSPITYIGKSYNTVQISSQCWLKENLDIGTMIQGTQQPTNNGIIEKYCLQNNQDNCAIYGGYYTWDEVMQYVTTEKAQGICPTGWHIPTKTEFQSLITAVNINGNALKALGQGYGNGTGTNTSGFSALIVGSYSNNTSYYFGFVTNFWSSTEFNLTTSYHFLLYADNNSFNIPITFKTAGFSVRCIKD
jgi:uncharacterized protein (TIGR02145 family)